MTERNINNKRHRNFTPPPPQFDEDIPPPPDFIDDDEDTPSDLVAFMGSMSAGDSGHIKVYKAKQGDARGMEFLFHFAPGDYTYEQLLSYLRDEYDGGSFVIKVHTGERNLLRMTERVSVAPPPKSQRGTPVIGNNNDSALVNIMREQVAQQQSMINTLVTSRHGGGGLGIRDILAAAPMIMGLMEKLTPKAPSVLEQIQAMQAMADFGRDISGNAPKESGFMDMLSGIMPAIGNAIATSAAAKEPAPTPQPRLPSAEPQPVTEAPPPQQPRQPENSDVLVLLKMLVRAAEQGADPQLYAEVVLDQLGENNCAAIVANPSILVSMAQQVPGIETQKEWFGVLLATLGEIMSDEPAPISGDDLTDTDEDLNNG